MPDLARSNMTPDELEAWTRGGGQPWGASLRGTVYHPGIDAHVRTPEQKAARTRASREEIAAAGFPPPPTDWQRTAPDREPLPDWPIEPVLEALQRERDQRRAEPIPLRVPQRPEPLPTVDLAALAALKREAEVTLHPTRAGTHGTLAAYLAGDRCLDCTNAANEAAMLGTYRP